MRHFRYTSLYSPSGKNLLVGVYPPPLGGVSVHIYRLTKLLKSKGINVRVFDISKKTVIPRFQSINFFVHLIINGYKTVHLHELSIRLMKVILCAKKIRPKFKLILTVHNAMYLDTLYDNDFIFFQSFISELETIIFVGNHIKIDYNKKNIKLPIKTYVEKAYLPPPITDYESIISTYPQKLMKFSNLQKPLLIANAFKIGFYNGDDLYGLDMCIELISTLKNRFPKIGLIFAIANDQANIQYFEKMKTEISKKGIENNIFFLTGQKEIWPLFKKCDIFIRPTNTDGDAISIREALCFDCKVIASDVVKRPAGVLTFKNRNQIDLFNMTLRLLEN